MKIKLKENELINLVKKVISEQNYTGTFEGQGKHPIDDPFYKKFLSDIEGDGVSGKKLDRDTLQFNCEWGPVYQLKKIK